MNIKVRYYSRSGNTKLLAESIAKGLNVEAISVDSNNSQIIDNTDILFVGGALYAYGLDKKLKEYLSNIESKAGIRVLPSSVKEYSTIGGIVLYCIP